MKHTIFVFLITVISANMLMSQSTNKSVVSLFERLGGTNGITLIVDDVIQAHMKNPIIKDIFTPLLEEPERLATIRQHTIEFFSAGSGGAVEYKGRDMVSTHKGMNITSEQYIYVVDDIMMVLKAHQIDENSQKDVLAILWSLKGMIIGQ
jgi:hemoglobin